MSERHEIERAFYDNRRVAGPVSDEVLEDIGYTSSDQLPAVLHSLPETKAPARRQPSSDALDEFGGRPTYFEKYERPAPEAEAASKVGLEVAHLALEQAQKPEPKH